MGKLQGKALIVTGAGRGIGAATAKYFVGQGASVVINDIDSGAAEECAAALRAAGGDAIANASDISNWTQASELVAACKDRFGAVDGLVNNAGLFSLARLDELTDGAFDKLLAVNVVGAANCAAHAIKVMLAQKSGAIVNVTSGAHMGIPSMGVYAASKGAIASLTYVWAQELQGTGVRVNAVSPLANTRMADGVEAYYRPRGMNVPPPAIMGEANAPVIAYLLSDEAAGINGQIVRIEGEQLALVAHPAVMLPTLEQPGGWTFDAIKNAFERDLAARQAPLGIVGVEIASYSSGSSFWKKNTD